MARLQQSFVTLMAAMLLMHVVTCQDRIDKRCNPSLKHRFDDCPRGYCCVRDEFLPTYVYCRKIGQEDENCTTKETDSECPCASGLYCKANIVSSFTSLYGRCYNASKDATTTTMATTTTAPTSDAASMKSDTPMSSAASVQTTKGSQPIDTGDPLSYFNKAGTTNAPTSNDKPSTRPAIDFPMPIIG